MRRSPRTIVVALAAAALAAGCGDTQSTTETIGSTGGVVGLASGLTLEVPAGALTESTEITVREQRQQGGVIEVDLEPEGLELAQEATLAWGDDTGAMGCERAAGGWLDVERNGNRAQIRLRRLERLRLRTRAHQCDGGGCCAGDGEGCGQAGDCGNGSCGTCSGDGGLGGNGPGDCGTCTGDGGGNGPGDCAGSCGTGTCSCDGGGAGGGNGAGGGDGGCDGTGDGNG